MGSGASSVPPVGSKRDFSAAESLHSVTPGPTKLVPGLPTDASAVNQAFPTSALHVGDAREVYDTPRLGADVGDDRSVGILGQRAGPFAVGVGGGGRFGS